MRLELVARQFTNSKGALIREGRRAVENTTFLNGFEGLGFQRLLELFGLFVGSAHEPTVRTTLADRFRLT